VETRCLNPKRVRREIGKELSRAPVGTKAQQALKLQYKARKVSQKQKRRKEREDEAERKFLLRQQKRREKHKGR